MPVDPNKEKYIVADEQPGKKPKIRGFEKKKDAIEYYKDLLDENKNKTGVVILYGRKGKVWVWLIQSHPTSTSGRKLKKIK